ncbi:hypothetical protein [Billgrantia aerodenitrificans]|uniref:rRNA-processing protein FYV7 n=1 Tax=Billgrantia aerodenitrificans TaxID=2733483 RepID=A0ABS9AVM4_9GAMM|nr:hypothetical protein [Halomonas aerodenitrificans]MCE8025834.1 hypothetical protein [Halomonas aerodenitrificans]
MAKKTSRERIDGYRARKKIAAEQLLERGRFPEEKTEIELTPEERFRKEQLRRIAADKKLKFRQKEKTKAKPKRRKKCGAKDDMLAPWHRASGCAFSGKRR